MLFCCLCALKDPKYAISVIVEHGGSGSKAAAPIAKKVIKKVLERDDLRNSQIYLDRRRNLMFSTRSIQSNLSFRDKIYSIDYILLFLFLILGIVSMFAMYSTDGGNFDIIPKVI